ncbi:MAG: Rpn family recombination-promoting nuclease/putative transposase [Defluviitaleaceae bacterium]|nr:Rpn family recombination-promoting nuclease/putative transposase [Defluviitaleaceae bacterium]
MIRENKAQDPVILALTIDGVFKLYFEDPRNLPELKRFLKAYLELSDDELSTINILNPGLLKDHVTDKGFTVDLLLKTKSGNDLHIEMQTNPHQNFKERIQLCNARKAGQQVKVGEDYARVKRTISLVITDFRIFLDEAAYHERIMMRRENGKVFTHVQELNIIDLTKLDSEKEHDKEKYLWGKLFKARTKEELVMLANESEEMAEAAEKLLKISADERAQAYAFSRDNAEFARKLHEQGIREEGIEQGIKRERQRAEAEKLRIAKKMIQRGDAAEEIVALIGVSFDVIEELRKATFKIKSFGCE